LAAESRMGRLQGNFSELDLGPGSDLMLVELTSSMELDIFGPVR